jgi:hypothetical protein
MTSIIAKYVLVTEMIIGYGKIVWVTEMTFLVQYIINIVITSINIFILHKEQFKLE